MNTVLQSFTEFRRKLELTESEKSNIQKSHTNLRKILEQTQRSPPIINTILHGSWKRRTTIRPINDIDILAILDSEYIHTYLLGIFTEYINPQTVLRGIKKRLSSKYSSSKIRTDRPCVIIELFNHSFEILPVYQQEIGYKIPNDRLNGWKSSDPDALAERITSANYRNDGKLVPLIKMLKHWKNEQLPTFPSFKLEEITCDIFDPDSMSTLSRWSKGIFEDWRYLFHDKWIESYPYAVNYWFERFQVIISSMTSIKLSNYDKTKVDEAVHLAKIAFKLWDKGKEMMSIEKWAELFGSSFPSL